MTDTLCNCTDATCFLNHCYCKPRDVCVAHENLRYREGDQPLPIIGQENVSEAVKRDLDERIALGIRRYGKPLQTFNGRDALLDAYQEGLDLVHYLKQAIMERDARKADG